MGELIFMFLNRLMGGQLQALAEFLGGMTDGLD